jgi:hypothetical protein
MMDPKVKDFPALIQSLANKHHDGKHYQMAKHLGIGSAVIPAWAKGQVISPRAHHIWKLCKTYDLDLKDVQALISKSKSRAIAPEVSDFKSLVHWIVKEHHDGRWAPMAKRVGVSPALVYQWRDGLVNQPSSNNLERICLAYGLDNSDVMTRLSKRH